MALLLTATATATALPTLSFPSYKSKPCLKIPLTTNLPRQCKPKNITLIRCIQESATTIPETGKYEEVRRSDFPLDFMFGASSSAIQTEGFKNGGRGPSTWDNMVKGYKEPHKMEDAVDSYNKYKEDVQMLKNMSADCYRFSISWSRILPDGNGEINKDGIEFYNNLINELVNNDIEPIVTLFHYDLPQALQDNYNGFMGRQIVDDFKNYADICFKNFGDRVKYWTTFNEPQIFSMYGDQGGANEGKKEPNNPYKVMHHMLLAHATAFRDYKENYYKDQRGEIGFPLIIQGFVPFSSSPNDISAAKRASDFYMGWILKPLTTGDYPFIMRALLRDKELRDNKVGDTKIVILPRFTEAEKNLVKGSFDFITVNYYTSRFTKGLPFNPNHVSCGKHEEDQHVELSVTDINGDPIGPLPRGDTNAYLYPQGIKHALLELRRYYGDIKTFISENGIMEPKEEQLPLSSSLKDDHRITYIRDHLKHLKEAIREGANVRAYCYWSLLDSLELASGNTVRMGLHYTNYENNFERVPKSSAKWFGKFLRNEG